VFVYMLLRPPEYLADVHERELEIRAMERRLGADQACPYCRNPADPSFLSCPYCGTKLKNACRRCKTPLDASWRLCPHCETPVTTAPPTPPAPTPAKSTPRSSREEPTRTRG
jgi:RNA polymerase subunit RPABC4/transcription elongation factor Spt4